MFVGLTSFKNGSLRASVNSFSDSVLNTVTTELFTQTICMHHDAVNLPIDNTGYINLFFDEDEKIKTNNECEVKCDFTKWFNVSKNSDQVYSYRFFQQPSLKLFILNSVFRL